MPPRLRLSPILRVAVPPLHPARSSPSSSTSTSQPGPAPAAPAPEPEPEPADLPRIAFAAGADAEALAGRVRALLANRWRLDGGARGLEKTFHFKTWTKVLDFTTVVGVRSKSEAHHATLVLRYGSVAVHWTTHTPPGLSVKDVRAAEYCDETAAHIGEVPEAQGAKCG